MTYNLKEPLTDHLTGKEVGKRYIHIDGLIEKVELCGNTHYFLADNKEVNMKFDSEEDVRKYIEYRDNNYTNESIV